MKKLLFISALMLSAVSLNAKLSEADVATITALKDGLKDDASVLATQIKPILENYLGGLRKLLADAVANGTLTQADADEFKEEIVKFRRGFPVRDALLTC